MTPAATAAAAAPTYELIPIGKIGDFPLNPREQWGDMAGLEASIRAQGVLEPILVRRAGDRFQVIAGSRRLKAARSAELREIPAILREATDTQALELALIENGHRQDIHRLNEAIALAQLVKLDPKAYTPATLGAKLGRPEKYIKESLKLLHLEGPARKAYAEDKISDGHALAIARLPASQQEAALDQCFQRLWATDDGARVLRPLKTLETWIRETVPLELASPSQETRDLFPEATKLAQSGTVIVRVHKGFGDLKRKGEKDAILGEGHWKKAGAKDDCARAGVIVLGADKGTVLRVCADQTCKKHFPKPKPSSSTSTRRSKAEVAKEKAATARANAKRALQDRVDAAIFRAAVVSVTGVTKDLLRLVADECLGNLDVASDAIAIALGELTGLKTHGRYGRIDGKVESLTDVQVARLLAATVLSHDAYDPKNLAATARSVFKVNTNAIRAEVEKAAKAEEKALRSVAGKLKAKAPKKGGKK
jgi:ParB family transcriptional regulator, chromosome partitioning protein